MTERVSAVGPNTTLADRKFRAGQRLFLGFQGFAPTADFKKLVAELQPSGFVIFKRNVDSPAQVRDLNRELASLVPDSHPAFIAVDQEGGRVQRIREPATRWPSMRTVGQSGVSVADISRAMALELAAMGFNMNFAPVADVDSNPDNPIIGDRSFGRTPQEVGRMVVEFSRAHQEAGIVACAKHFPGHGDTDVDSHLALPKVEREDRDLRHLELAPFQAAVAAGVGSIMTAHVLFPAWDEDVPATMSERIIKGILRDELGFEGVVFSDDMEMKAVRGRYEVSHQVQKATAATVDVFLCCESHEVQHEVFTELVRAQEIDATLDTRSTDSVNRVMALRERFLACPPATPDLGVVGSQEHHDLALLAKARGLA